MADKRPNRKRLNSKNCESGPNCNGNDANFGNIVFDRKRKSKKHSPQPLQLFMNENDYRLRLQEVLYTPEHILTKIFRKDGPSLGIQFDSIPSSAFVCDTRKSHHEGSRRPRKRRKFSVHTILDCQDFCENTSPPPSPGLGSSPMTADGTPTRKHGIGKGLMTRKAHPGKKHGIGKGLMTQNAHPGKKHGIGKGLIKVWQVINSDGRGFPCGTNFSEGTIQKKKKRVQWRQSILRKLTKKEQAKKKTSLRSRKLECRIVEKLRLPQKEKCGLALEDVKCLENSEQFAMLLDDEELELRELQEKINLPSCSAHFPTNGSHGCSLCKDLLAKFPPNSVSMKLPLCIQPWASSAELVTKLFKAFHFLCTYAVTISIHSFTLDEFADAFHDKDSLLLGKVHLALLKLLLSDIEKELMRGFSSHAKKNCKFLGLLQSLEHHGSVLEFWQKSLNLLTWTEILRQLFVAAGFGSKLGMTPKGRNKDVNLMEKYGLSPGTLKGVLFSILLTKGNSGMKISELATSSSVVELNLTDTFHDLENLITTTLSGDVTLFEKISSSAYRLRIHTAAKECEDCSSDSEDFGSVDDATEVSHGKNTVYDSEYESRDLSPSSFEQDVNKHKTNVLTMHNEIDESHPGEVWLLGLMDGEYSDLSVEEKLNTLVALIDLISAGSSIKMEDPLIENAECPLNVNHHGSGAKIKRSTTKQCNYISLIGSCSGHASCGLNRNTSEQPIDSLIPMSRIGDVEKQADAKKISEEIEGEDYLHPMQSIFLGSDRRYNRYWLLLGPCNELDPGHKRIYFESSEDGHWEMIDSQESLCSLLSVLDRRGSREAHLLASLERREAILCQAMASPSDSGNRLLTQSNQSEINTSREMSSSPMSDVDNQLSLSEMQNGLPSSTYAAVSGTGNKGEQQAEKACRPQAFDAWIWKSFYFELNTVKNGEKAYLNSLKKCDQCQDLYWRDEKHCRICHTTFELDFDLEERYTVHIAFCRANHDVNRCTGHRVLSSPLQALKAAIYAIESAVPEDALLGSWKRSAHNLWVNRLRRASSLTEFLQVLADFVSAINEDWFYQNNNISSPYCLSPEIFSSFSTMPQTYSAVALWLVKLDLVVSSHVECSHS